MSRRRLGRFTTTLMATALATTLAGPASAASADGWGVLEECKGAHGPGHVNKHCITVVHDGATAYSLHGQLQSTWLSPPGPAYICGVDINIWGWRPHGGGMYELKGRVNDCHFGSVGLKWTIQEGQPLEPGSLVCSRATYDAARVPEPVCVRLP